MDDRVSVLVTGFGPFGEHKINASWEAVKELESIGFGNNINLTTQEIPVEYETVSALIPALWQKYKPRVCVHVGVSGFTDVVQLETCAHNLDYCREDISYKCPSRNSCVLGGSECLQTDLNVEKICQEVDSKLCPCKLETSCDAGRYLCEFIYYSSLHQSLKPEHTGSSVVFIHVPVLDQPYTKTQLGQTLKFVILQILKQLN
ncbi:pyroglutamyl-peptidase 1-like [Dendronephthya gigantea]|uniref:pyroglutamyl-peptidase 1-like n=1 Tax=Dendronephthya gigantea TaxID=151771 RepID=UPI00106BB02F|nr:pyroglutamyl-peptidase 1-like [Dendronephthya gigantea]